MVLRREIPRTNFQFPDWSAKFTHTERDTQESEVVENQFICGLILLAFFILNYEEWKNIK